MKLRRKGIRSEVFILSAWSLEIYIEVEKEICRHKKNSMVIYFCWWKCCIQTI